MWVEVKDAESPPEPLVLGYVNVVPECQHEGDLLTTPVFEEFGQTLQRFNEQLKEKPLPGII